MMSLNANIQELVWVPLKSGIYWPAVRNITTLINNNNEDCFAIQSKIKPYSVILLGCDKTVILDELDTDVIIGNYTGYMHQEVDDNLVGTYNFSISQAIKLFPHYFSIDNIPSKISHVTLPSAPSVPLSKITGNDENVNNQESQSITQAISKISKRQNVLSWDDYFMSVAFLSAMRSKDPSTQVGACIVNDDRRIVGMGYNGFPRGCSDDLLPWDRVGETELDTKYPYVVHAECNAILNKNSADVKGCVMYVALFPCNECSKLIIQSGIKEVIYICDKYHHTSPIHASKRLLDLAGVKYRQYKPKNDIVQINFNQV